MSNPKDQGIDNSNRPHEQFTFYLFTNLRRAAIFLQKQYTAEQNALINWATLRIISSTFVGDDLSKALADIVYSVEFYD
ncbi:MAG: Rpn family recombination-promoting nuclease/putative transposase [Cyanobacteria bacterium P01_H01_bin.74]